MVSHQENHQTTTSTSPRVSRYYRHHNQLTAPLAPIQLSANSLDRIYNVQSPNIINPRPTMRKLRLVVLLLIMTMTTMSLFYLLLAVSPCALAKCYKGYSSPFSFDAHLAQHPSWMSQVADSANLTSLSIPGTHDTMTYSIGSDVLQCQNWNLTVQLASGLRYFDIRARQRDDQLQIYHADGYTGHSYQDVLLAMFDFLDANPSEAIIMRLKKEGDPIGPNNPRSFEETFNSYWHSNPVTAQGAQKHFHVFNSSAALPTLGSLRSKIFILQNFPSEKSAHEYGIGWEDPGRMVLQDDWIVPDVQHLPQKWAAIKKSLERASTDPQDNQHIYLSHVSASVGVLPIEAAAGPKNRTTTGMNDETGRWLEQFEGDAKYGGRTGVVILDFPGKRLIQDILGRNKLHGVV